MKSIYLIGILVLGLVACGDSRLKLKDSQGRVFVRVRESKPVADGIVNAELWQLEGKIGPDYAYYLKLLQVDTNQPPFFTQAQ